MSTREVHQCRECKAKFPSHGLLVAHLTEFNFHKEATSHQKEENASTCSKCQASFDTKKELTDHLNKAGHRTKPKDEPSSPPESADSRKIVPYIPAGSLVGLGLPAGLTLEKDGKGNMTASLAVGPPSVKQGKVVAKRALAVHFLIDFSGSMATTIGRSSDTRMSRVLEGAKTIFDELHPKDRVTIEFFTTNGNQVVRKHVQKRTIEWADIESDSKKASGGTPLYDSIGTALENLPNLKYDEYGAEEAFITKKGEKAPKRTILLVVCTDGQDTDSTMWDVKKPSSSGSSQQQQQQQRQQQNSLFNLLYGNGSSSSIGSSRKYIGDQLVACSKSGIYYKMICIGLGDESVQEALQPLKELCREYKFAQYIEADDDDMVDTFKQIATYVKTVTDSSQVFMKIPLVIKTKRTTSGSRK